MKRIIILLLFLLFIFFPKKVNAEIIFQDDFSNGSSSNWTVVRGDPSLLKVQDGKYGALVSTQSTMVGAVAADIDIQDYAVEFDIYPIQGVDKNIDFRFIQNLIGYDIHFGDSGAQLNKSSNPEGWPKLSNFSLTNGQSYHVKAILNGKHIIVFINDQKIFDEIDNFYEFTSNENVGIIISTGAAAPTEVWFDNFIVRTLDPSEETSDLDVPLLKQTSDPWQSSIYDSANLWSPSTPTINRWGCALTSATMILKYYGINKMPDASSIDPGTVNSWLKLQPDGYIGNGLINWLAVARLSRLAKDSGLNEGFTFDALEYTRFSGNNTTQLTQDIQNSQPDILETPGHFIVAKGINGDTFNINDPFFERITLNDGYNNTFSSISHYTPSNTDLSYLMLTIPTDIDITLSDGSNNLVGDQFIQQPIKDPLSILVSGNPIKVVYLKKPSGGNYTVKLSGNSNTPYVLTSYLYDINGNVKIFTNSGVVSQNNSRTLPIVFNKEDSNNSSVKKDPSFQSIIDYINQAIMQKKITNVGGKALITLLKTAEKSYKARNVKAAKAQLIAAEAVLNALKKSKGVSSDIFTTLSEDLRLLNTSLK